MSKLWKADASFAQLGSRPVPLAMRPVMFPRLIHPDCQGSAWLSSSPRLGSQMAANLGLHSGDIFCTMTLSLGEWLFCPGFRQGEDGINPQLAFQ